MKQHRHAPPRATEGASPRARAARSRRHATVASVLAGATACLLLVGACAHHRGAGRGVRVLYLAASAGPRATGPTRAALAALATRARARGDRVVLGAPDVRAALPADVRWPRVISPPMVGWLEQVTARAGDPWAPPRDEASRAAWRSAAQSLDEIALNSSDAPKLRQRLLDVGIFRAMAAHHLGDAAGARRRLEDLASLFGPDMSPTPGAFPPSALALYEDARRAVAGAPEASLVVRSTPPGAEIYVNGRRAGARTPARLKPLRAGPVELQVALDEARSLRHRIYLDPGPNAVTIDLGFEGAVRLSRRWVGLRYPCWSSFQAHFTAHAAKLARWVHAARVVAVLGQPQPAGAVLTVYDLGVATGELVQRRLNL